jgi:hypothetical protein
MLALALLFNLGLDYGCQNHSRKKITNKELSVIAKSCVKQTYPVSIYYLDGDCSFCLGKAKEFDERKPSEDSIRIILFRVSNPILTKMYIQDISLRSCIILDSTDLFAKSLKFNTIYKLSEKGEILAETAD